MRAFAVFRPRAGVVVLASVAAIALLLASTIVRADTDSDGDGVPDSVELATQRNVATVTLGDAFSIESRLVNAPDEDEFGLTYKAGTFDVSYVRPGGGGSGYQLQIASLVEWVDLNADHRIDPGEIRWSTPLGNSAFEGVPVVHTNVTNADGGRINFFVIRSATGQVTLNLTVAQRFMRLGDRILTPMEVKMDVTIDHSFNQTGMSMGIEFQMSPGGRFESGNRSWDDENGFATNDAAVNISGGPPDRASTVFFSWNQKASADGREIPVGFSSRLDPLSGNYSLYLGYPIDTPQPRVNITHDPILGVESAAYQDILVRPPALQWDFLLYAGTVAAMAVIVGATIVFANRRRRKREA